MPSCTIINQYLFPPVPPPLTITTGTGVVSNAIYPMYIYWEFGWFATLYTQAEIGSTKTITKIAYDMFNNVATTYNNFSQTITMFHANETSFPVGLRNNMTPTTPGTWAISDETDVKINFTWTIPGNQNGYIEITLDTPFIYNGVDSLIIRWKNEDGSWETAGNNPTSFGGGFTGNKAYSDYQDGSLPALTASGFFDSFRPNIRLTFG